MAELGPIAGSARQGTCIPGPLVVPESLEGTQLESPGLQEKAVPLCEDTSPSLSLHPQERLTAPPAPLFGNWVERSWFALQRVHVCGSAGDAGETANVSKYPPEPRGHRALLLVSVPTFADLLLSGQG